MTAGIMSRYHSSVAPYDGTIWNNVATFSPVTGVSHCTFWSKTMGKVIGYSIFLPAGYPAGAPYNVIYSCPGGGSNENDFATTLTHYAAAHPVIVVFLNGDKKFFHNAVVGAPMYHSMMTETAIITELIPHIDANYRTKGTKGGRALSGVSGGGCIAFRFGLKYPEKFSSMYIYCAAIDDNAGNVAAGEPAMLTNLFNGSTSAFGAQTAQSIAASNAANIIAQAPAIHFVCGTADSLLDDNQNMDAVLTTNSIVHDPLEEISGAAHNIAQLWAGQGAHDDLDFMWSHFS